MKPHRSIFKIILAALIHTGYVSAIAVLVFSMGVRIFGWNIIWQLTAGVLGLALYGLRLALHQTQSSLAQTMVESDERHFRFLAESIPHHVWTTLPDGTIEYCNLRMLEFFAAQEEELRGQPVLEVMRPEQMEQCAAQFAVAGENLQEFRVECRIRDRGGEYRWFQLHALPVLRPDGGLVRWFGTSTDIEERKLAEAGLHYAASHDVLTGLANRKLLLHELRIALHRRRQNLLKSVALLFIDLDRFKVVNDSLGHEFGDRLLLRVAEVLKDCVRPHDVVARIGGDEFVILVTDLEEAENSASIAQRILERMESPLQVAERTFFVTASIGLAVAGHDDDADGLLRDADTAMYHAKSAGKNRACTFERSMLFDALVGLELETDLRRAAKRGDLLVWYQPIYSIASGEIEGFEALSRWRHPERGFVPPSEFIPLAEDTGIIIDLGRSVLEKACAQVKLWNDRFGMKLTVSVNLSPRQIADVNLLGDIRRILAITQFPASLLKLEVVESVMMEDPASAEHVLRAAREMGIEICLDDFGTGYSSLSYLLRYPFDTVKIDRSFVTSIDSDSARAEVVRTVVQLAANLRKNVVAEGVETEGELHLLQGMRCDSAQGFLMSRPLSPELVNDLLERERHKVSSAVPLLPQSTSPELLLPIQ